MSKIALVILLSMVVSPERTVKLICNVFEELKIDAHDLLEKMLVNPKAESINLNLCPSVVKDDRQIVKRYNIGK